MCLLEVQQSCSKYSTLSSWLSGCRNVLRDCRDTDWIPTAITASRCSTDSKRPHRCCHLSNNFGSCWIFHILYHWWRPQNCHFALGDPSPHLIIYDFLGPSPHLQWLNDRQTHTYWHRPYYICDNRLYSMQCGLIIVGLLYHHTTVGNIYDNDS